MKKAVFVGQAMPRNKRHPHDWPSLNKWLYSVGFTKEEVEANFCYSALVDYFPGSKGGSHLVPREDEIEKERSRLKKVILSFNPECIVTVGKLSSAKCLNHKVSKLSDIIGREFSVDPYNMIGRRLQVIPLPHPSGASTWRHSPENQLLLTRALKLLRRSLSK